jgi:hypothetical protein
MRSTSPAADEARRDFREIMERKGHAVDNARDAVARLEQAFGERVLLPTPDMEDALAEMDDIFAFAKEHGDEAADIAADRVARALLKLVDEAEEPEYVYVIEDELHAEPLGEFASFDDAVSEVQRISQVPWGTSPNVAPCKGGMENCGRHYEIREYDLHRNPRRQVRVLEAARIEANGERWVADFVGSV